VSTRVFAWKKQPVEKKARVIINNLAAFFLELPYQMFAK
jgi:hypothetical protein